MKAVVMAGGAGSRLRPLTIGRPKPMVPILEKPVLEHILDLLKRHGVEEVVITLQYMASVIQNYFGDGEAFGLRIHYFIEESPLGTAGSVRQALELLEEPFLVISGDALTDIDLSRLVAFHKEKGSALTVALSRVQHPVDYGVVITDPDGRIRQFVEKPTWGEVMSDTVNMGIYVIDPDVLTLVPPEKAFDFSQDLFPIMLEQDRPMYGFVSDGYWCDIGDHITYAQANADYLAGRIKLPIPGRHLGDGIWAADDVEIAHDAQLYGPVFLGRGANVKDGAIIHGPAVIGEDTVIDSHARVDRSIIWRNTYVGEGAEVRGAVVCRQCRLKANAVLFEGSVLGDGCVLGEHAIIHANVRLWPGKEVEPGAIVKSSIIWGSQARRVIFGRYGVTGVVNVDLTPEFAARLGAAFGAMHPTGAVVTVNRDLNRTSRMLKRAIIAGLPSVGVNAVDIENVPVPVARFFTRASGAAGGVHVRVSPYQRRVVDIKFFDKDGLTINHATERAIERAFFREDFRRVHQDDIGYINSAPDVITQYGRRFMDSIDTQAIRTRRFSLVVDYAHAPVSLVLPPLFEHLGCDVVTLNSYLDPERMSITRPELDRDLTRLARITGATGADFGVRFDVSGERIFMIDGRGERISDSDFALTLIDLSLRGAARGQRLVVPANASMAAERVAAQHDMQVIRSRMDPTSLMLASTQPDVMLAADGLGHFVFPAFHHAIDGMFAAAKFMELLAVHDTTLADTLAALPPHHVVHKSVHCPWEARGRLMRRLLEEYQSYRIEQIDGIRIDMGEAWALVHPDPDSPTCNIYAESTSEEESHALGLVFASIVDELKGP
ncbi:MAG: mannose-1-phosphate guanyltransferase [Chloroflexi bacterium]|nr:mannose-1-phosphate guanyltransferase [Chloroflexota bacterium]